MKKAKHRPKTPDSRKVLRKQKRQEKKQKRQVHYAKKKNTPEPTQFTPGRFVKRPADAIDINEGVKKKKQKIQPTTHEILNKDRLKVKKETQRLQADMDKQRKKIFMEANEDEDKIIKKLEKQLGLNKSKNKNNYFADDGLDYLLEICDRSTTEQIVAAEKHLANVEDVSDFEEDLAIVTGKKIKKEKIKKLKHKTNEDKDSEIDDDSSSDIDDSVENDDASDGDMAIASNGDNSISGDDDDISDEGEYSDEEIEEPEEQETTNKPKGKVEKSKATKAVGKPVKSTKQKIVAKQESEESDDGSTSGAFDTGLSEDEVSHLSGDDETDDENEAKDEKIKEKPDVWEDIYGRKRDKEGNVIKEERGVYIPPHLRNKDTASEKDLVHLKRQIKSVLNKLAGTNLHWACTSIENLYSSNSRNSVNTALSDLFMEATISPSVTPDRMVAEHVALISVLHANVGNEIGAHFLQIMTKQFDDMVISPEPLSDKKLDNLVSCLAHLYSFKIYHATLLYDILSRLLADLTEKHIECVLVALRAVGGVLRREEPGALKDFIHDTQRRVAALSERAAGGSRIKFLLEVLMAVKNNNLTKIPNYDPSYTEELKKMTRSIIRKGNYITPLNIRLEDLLKVEERGKWWVVGSAWEGNRMLAPETKTGRPAPNADQKMLELARKQRINTDVRRSIFCVIMSAEDYMDAFEKLQHLGLKGQQEREVVHVLLACCLQEKTYNPYYAVLGQKLCDFDRKYQLSIQYAVWDKIKDLEGLSKLAATNLAQFLIHLIMEKGLPLSVLKVIEFSDLNKSTVRFMRQILLAIIMSPDQQASREVFSRVAAPGKLRLFRESLRLFLQHFLVRRAARPHGDAALTPSEANVLKERVAEIDRVLTVADSKMKF